MMRSEFASKIRLESDAAIEALRTFIDDKLVQTQTEYDYFNAVREFMSVWVVSRLGRIVDNRLELTTTLFSDEGGVAVAGEDYFPVGEVARWKPEYATGDYINKLQLAHERRVRQLEYCLKQTI